MQSIRPVLEGLTVSGAVNLLSRAKKTDSLIESVHLVSRWGVIVASTEDAVVGRVPLQILFALSPSEEGNRTAETALDFIGRASIVNETE